MISPALIKVGIADDHEIFRDGLKLILTRAPSVELVFEARNGTQLIELTKKNQPDVILTDIVMPEMDGIEAVKKNFCRLPCNCLRSIIHV